MTQMAGNGPGRRFAMLIHTEEHCTRRKTIWHTWKALGINVTRFQTFAGEDGLRPSNNANLNAKTSKRENEHAI